MGHEVELLVDHADAQRLGRLRPVQLHFVSFIKDAAAVFFVDAVEHLHQGGFPRAVFPDQRVNLPRVYGKVYVVEGVDAGKILVDMLHLDQVFSHGTTSNRYWIKDASLRG